VHAGSRGTNRHLFHRAVGARRGQFVHVPHQDVDIDAADESDPAVRAGQRGVRPRIIRRVRHPVTPPAARPAVTYRWKTRATATGGIAASRPPADSSPKSVANLPENSATATGIVLDAGVDVKISA